MRLSPEVLAFSFCYRFVSLVFRTAVSHYRVTAYVSKLQSSSVYSSWCRSYILRLTQMLINVISMNHEIEKFGLSLFYCNFTVLSQRLLLDQN
jgi:hypothetical protein